MSKSIEVVATANGHYGNKHRVPGEKFSISQPEDFSIVWMTTEDKTVLDHVKKKSEMKFEAPAIKVAADPSASAAERHAAAEAKRHREWLENRAPVSDATETRRVNTGGTDGVVGAAVPKPGAKLSAKERIAAANSASGRTDIKSAAEADTVLAALSAATGSDNDDRSRDLASDPADNPAPAADWEEPI